MQKAVKCDTITLVIFMATTLYIVRHCEALGNLSGRFQGQIDHDITETGAKQLVRLAERFENIEIDAVYASPLIRAHKTAKAVADKKGLPVTLMEALKELNIGELENVTHEAFKRDFYDMYYTWVYEPWAFEAPGGEKMTELYERIWGAVLKIAKENSGKTVLVASHGCAIRNIICRVLYNDIKKLKEAEIVVNTGVTKLVFDEKGCAVEYIGDHSHLSEEELPPSSRFALEKSEK